MPDWRELVKQRLKGIQLTEQDAAEVSEELAVHLESVYQTSVSEGFTEQVAVQRALSKVSNWHELRTKIESSRKKELPMNKRVLQFWFPAFLTILLAMVALMIIEKVGPKPWISPEQPLRVTPVAVVYFAWLLTLPFIGAFGAYLSGRAGARRGVVFSSVIFPIFPYLAFFVVGLPIAVILDDHVAHNIMLPAFFIGLAAWVILPAVALLAGGVLVQYFFKRSDSRRIANA